MESLTDELKFGDDQKSMNLMHNEKIIYSGKITKKNTLGFNQTRNIVVTEKSLYNFDGKSKQYI